MLPRIRFLMESDDPRSDLASSPVDHNKEALVFLSYSCLYVTYLFLHPEGEWLHWLTLVALPSIVLFAMRRRTESGAFAKTVLPAVGLRKDNFTRGLWLAVLLGGAISVLQVFMSHRQEQIWEIIVSGRIAYLLPLVVGLLVVTAGFTEEFFFRGVLQARLTDALESRAWGIVIASILFGLYHLPYAYLNPAWPSHGEWPAAFGAALGQGLPMGLILGWIYEKYDRNLLACIVVHTLTNALPATTMIQGL